MQRGTTSLGSMTLPENELCWCSCNIVQRVIRWRKPDRCVILVCQGSFPVQRFLSCICCDARGWQLQLFIVPQEAVRWIRSIPSIGKSPTRYPAVLLPIESQHPLTDAMTAPYEALRGWWFWRWVPTKHGGKGTDVNDMVISWGFV